MTKIQKRGKYIQFSKHTPKSHTYTGGSSPHFPWTFDYRGIMNPPTSTLFDSTVDQSVCTNRHTGHRGLIRISRRKLHLPSWCCPAMILLWRGWGGERGVGRRKTPYSIGRLCRSVLLKQVSGDTFALLSRDLQSGGVLKVLSHKIHPYIEPFDFVILPAEDFPNLHCHYAEVTRKFMISVTTGLRWNVLDKYGNFTLKMWTQSAWIYEYTMCTQI